MYKFNELSGTFFKYLDIFYPKDIFIKEEHQVRENTEPKRKFMVKMQMEHVILTPQWQKAVLDLMRRMGDL